MTEGEIQTMLDRVAVEREADAVLVDAKRRIRRGRYIVGQNVLRAADGGVTITAEVWDDEYATTLVFVDGTPRPELVRGIFLDRKREHRR